MKIINFLIICSENEFCIDKHPNQLYYKTRCCYTAHQFMIHGCWLKYDFYDYSQRFVDIDRPMNQFNTLFRINHTKPQWFGGCLRISSDEVYLRVS